MTWKLISILRKEFQQLLSVRHWKGIKVTQKNGARLLLGSLSVDLLDDRKWRWGKKFKIAILYNMQYTYIYTIYKTQRIIELLLLLSQILPIFVMKIWDPSRQLFIRRNRETFNKVIAGCDRYCSSYHVSG